MHFSFKKHFLDNIALSGAGQGAIRNSAEKYVQN